VRWPATWPPDSRRALLAATYAKGAGRATAFSLAAFRQAFAAGRDLGDEATIVLAGAACELHPRALLTGIASRAVADALDRATASAAAAGARALPALLVGDALFDGDDALDRAVAAERRA
jgi:2-hydroxychromene-2-carboxylate isomerase